MESNLDARRIREIQVDAIRRYDTEVRKGIKDPKILQMLNNAIGSLILPSTVSDRPKDASDKAESFICEWTCAESLEEMKRDSWSTSDVHSILVDFILSSNK